MIQIFMRFNIFPLLIAACWLLFTAQTSACHQRRARCCQPCRANQPEPSNPFAENARHPREVERILALLPELPAEGTYEEIIEMLGLPPEWDGGDVDARSCSMVWEQLAPGYMFALGFEAIPTEDRLTLRFTEASFAAQGKPGFDPEEFHTVYPYRHWRGMVEGPMR